MAYNDVEKDMAKRILKNHCSWWYELRYDEIRNKPYFIGKRFSDSETEILLPVNCYKAMTFQELKTFIIDSGSTSVNIAVYNSDSTVVLYKAEFGLNISHNTQESEMSLLSDDSDVAGPSKKIKLSSIPDNSTTTSDCLQLSESAFSAVQNDEPSIIDSDMGERENSQTSNDSLND